MLDMQDYRYELTVKEAEKPFRVSKELRKKLAGISSKLISRMRREAVNCPVLGRDVSFVECYLCPNFVRRVRGVVHCRGLPLER